MKVHESVAAMQDIKIADWSAEVAPFWGAVMKSAMSGEGIKGLFKAGWTTIKACFPLDCSVTAIPLHCIYP